MGMEQEQKWVSVKERLPETIDDYLVYIQKPELKVRYRALETFDGDGGWCGQNEFITHWQPLPDPPNEAEASHEGQ